MSVYAQVGALCQTPLYAERGRAFSGPRRSQTVYDSVGPVIEPGAVYVSIGGVIPRAEAKHRRDVFPVQTSV